MPKPRNDKNTRKATPSRFRAKPSPSKEYQHQNQLQETDVGITQFISTLEGFSGVIKARFSDFQVNEIDLSGEIAKLTNQQIPKDCEESKDKIEMEASSETPLSQIPQNVWDDIKTMLQSSEASTVELDATNLTKEQRTEIHESLKKVFGRKIVGNTVVEGETKKMVFKKYDGKGEKRLNWPKDRGEYVHFLVYKESVDTLDATLKISSCLKMPASSFTYAGVKDKRAKTTQWFCVKKVEPWKLIIKTKSLWGIKVGNITFRDKPLKLGDLRGNKFRIALRNITGSDDLIEQSLQSLKDKGFINYYGLQRFGNDKEVPTFAIGMQLLLGNWKEACEIILKPTRSDRPDFPVTKAKKIYTETGDASKALEEFDENRKSCIEYLLLSGLSKGHANDYVTALSSIPRNTRLLYLHSFQSLVWNSVVSKRIEKYGLEVVEGDLVYVEHEQNNDNNEDGEASEPKRVKVKALSSDECSKYTIYDIILPLPGFDVTYPKHLEEFYKETLEKHGLTLEMTRQKVKEYSLSGAYRKLMGQAQNLSWKIMHYNDPNCNLIRSDFEELRGQKEPIDVTGGAYKALILEFNLDSASYATMVLREILKTDTSASANAKLNNYHSGREEKKFRTEEVSNDNESEEFTEKVGLLSDAKKYEAFKNLVFGDEEPNLKRKYEECEETMAVKVAKIEENGS